MRRSHFLTRIMCPLLLLAADAAGQTLRVFVSPAGNDRWSGTIAQANPSKTDGPVASLARARDVVRASARAGGAVVSIHAGDYFMSAGLTLAAEDSGTDAAPIVYEARDGGAVHLIGGRDVGGFTPVKDPAVLGRLSPEARGRVLQADLKSQGVTDLGKYRSRGFGRPGTPAALEVFFDDQPMTLARWPNDGFVKIAAVPKDQQGADEHGGTLGNLAGGFHYSGDRPRRWKPSDDIWVHGYWAYDWANSYERVASLDPEKHLIKTAAPGGIYGFRAGQRFYFLNVLEELDSPGEWFADRTSGVVYFWPPRDVANLKVRVSTVEQPLVALKDVSHVTLRGLTIECTRGDGIRIDGGTGVAIERCTVRNVGDTAVVVHGGTHHRVTGCEVSNTGDGGISLSGGDRKTLTPANHLAENNRLHHIARWSKCYQPAIGISGVGIRAAHNLIHDHPHCGILLAGNDHVIEFNEIHHVCLETGDVGAVYMGRDYTYRGNVIQYNFIHDTGGVGMGSMGVYMDDCVSGTVIRGNLFKNAQRAVFLGGGRDFTVDNNVFIDCKPAVELDARGLDKRPVWHDMVNQYMRERFEAMNPDRPPYATRYPELADLRKYYATQDGVPPGNVTVTHNINVGGAGAKWLSLRWGADASMTHVADNVTGADPGFVDAAEGNYQLRDDAPALKAGFRRLPLEQVGPKR